MDRKVADGETKRVSTKHVESSASFVGIRSRHMPTRKGPRRKAEGPRPAMAVKFHTPPENQGQIILVSYGWSSSGALLRKTFDQSDRSVVIRRLADPWGLTAEGSREALQLENWDAWNSCPPGWLEDALDEAPIVNEREVYEDDEA